MKKITNNYLTITTIILLSLVVLTFWGVNKSEFLAALIYPIEVKKEELRPGNVLIVESFVDGRKVNGANITQVPDYGNLNSNPSSGMGESTNYEKIGENLPKHKEWPEIKNIVLKAPNTHGGGYFSGWSGCDATNNLQQEIWKEPVTEGNLCQVSVTDSQIRKIEAHYTLPNEKLGLQIFSISNNPLRGTLNDSWLNTKPDLIYKASYIELDNTQIPDTIGQLSVADKLQLNLGGNKNIDGQIPEETDNLGSIDYLGLYKGNLDKEIPDTLGNSLSPIYFLAYMNELPGKIPESLGNMGARPARFELHDNQLEGEVPYNLRKLTGLEPKELRLYNNKLTSTESNLIQDSNWMGVNFNSNQFSTTDAMSTLYDAASRGGTYIDFCKNPANGGNVEYNIDGSCNNTNIEDAVNKAAEAGWDVYIKIKLYQDYKWWECSNARCDEVNDPDTGDCIDAESTGCQPTVVSGQKPFCDGNAVCVRIKGPINSCEDIIPNSVGLPYHVYHASHCPGCDYWTHLDCKPICDLNGICTCSTNTLSCRQIGTVNGSRDSLPKDNIEPFRSTGCFDVHTTY